MTQVIMNPTASAMFGGSALDLGLAATSPKAKVRGERLASTGYHGGGVMRCANRSILAEIKRSAQSTVLDSEASLQNRTIRRSIEHTQSTHSLSAGGSISQTQDSTGLPNETQEMRKQAEIMSKWGKVEAQRLHDQKRILDLAERGRERRNERFDRLLNAVTGRDNLAYKTAMALRERENHEQKRRKELYDAWEEKVYQPLVRQSHACMNPPNRALQQKANGGTKNVDFKLPQEKHLLVVNVFGDPVRMQAADHARENAFNHAVNHFVHGSQSAPDLRDHLAQSALMRGGVEIAAARSRPTLEPTHWGQVKLAGTLFGHFAQVCEQGPGFKRSIRGGANKHLPDTSDGILAGGSRHSREHGYGDVGILRGDKAAQGESSHFKTQSGAGSGAPMQDHYQFEQGPHVTKLEYEPGKRIFPQYH